jgi:hypothetical protein
MNYHAFLAYGLGWVIVCFNGLPARAGDSPAVDQKDQATIYFSFAPWDGAAYAIEIPLESADDRARPGIRINIWGNPEFQKPRTISFTGKEDPGGGPSRGDGRAIFQADFNKSMPERLEGSISFTSLQNNVPVSGSYEFATLDGKRKFRGRFQAVWGNGPPKVIR